MRNFVKVLVAASLVFPLVAACSDDPASDNPGAEPGKGGSGGSASGGKAGSTGKGGSANIPKGGEAQTGGADPVPEGGMTGEGGSGGAPLVAECDLADLTDGGEVPASGILETGNFYTLKGLVKVTKTLTIEPCVKILGDSVSLGTLVVMPGGKLMAEGTADAPILFTSSEPEGSRAPGDWGGVIMLGNGVCNDATVDTLCEIEGLTDGTVFGNTAADAVEDESSGSLAYVRIEYPGIDLDGQGNEINGLTLGGVGSGTTLSHVMVSNTLDDCFEWFGGTVNADHLVAHNCGDDMFDADAGYSGFVQFAFGRQGTTITSDPNGFEMDNDSVNADKAPVSSPSFANVTLCGTGTAVAGSGPQVGMVLRRGLDATIVNAVVTGFFTAGLSVRNTPNTQTTLTDSLVFGNTAEFDATHTGGATWFSAQTGNSDVAPANFGDCFTAVPAPFPAAAIEGGTPTGHADLTATYVGAFADADDTWMTGAWTDWATE